MGKEKCERTPNREEFWAAVRKTAAMVGAWPEWKRNVLGTPLKRKEKEMKEVTDE